MKITTKEFGELQVESEDIINFVRPIYGFEEYKNYVILKDKPDDDIMYFQSIENSSLHFVIVDPYIIMPNYNPEISDDDLAELNVNRNKIVDLKFMLIAIISENIENSVVNLKSPIVINPHNKYAIQALVQNQNYPLRYPLFKKVVDGDDNASN